MIWLTALLVVTLYCFWRGERANRNEHFSGVVTYTAGIGWYRLGMYALCGLLSGIVIWIIEVVL